MLRLLDSEEKLSQVNLLTATEGQQMEDQARQSFFGELELATKPDHVATIDEMISSGINVIREPAPQETPESGNGPEDAS